MNSDGSSSESDISSFGDVRHGSDASVYRYPRRRIRRESITSVSTNPQEDAYVMVLQNRLGVYEDVKSMTSLKNKYDVTFLAGHEGKPVNGVRAIIQSKSRLLYELIQSFEKNRHSLKCMHKSNLRKIVSKLNKFSCASGKSRHHRNDVTKHLTIPMEIFDAETFQRLMNYIHTGNLTIDATTVMGLLNAAHMFDLPEMKRACWDFALGCAVRADNLNDLLSSAKKYPDHKMTIELVKMLRQSAANSPDLLVHSRTLVELTHPVYRRYN